MSIAEIIEQWMASDAPYWKAAAQDLAAKLREHTTEATDVAPPSISVDTSVAIMLDADDNDRDIIRAAPLSGEGGERTDQNGPCDICGSVDPRHDNSHSIPRTVAAQGQKDAPGRIAEILNDAQEKVRPIVDKERQGENVGDVMDFRMKGMGPAETFEWLRQRSNRLTEVEAELEKLRVGGSPARSVEARTAVKEIEAISTFLTGPYASQPGYLKGWGETIRKDCAAILAAILGSLPSPAPPPELNALLPCPFCGSSNVKLDHLVDEDDYFVSCGDCEVQQIANYTATVAVQRWNSRERLLESLQRLYDETADYIRINNLGDVHHNQAMQMARDALAGYKTELEERDAQG